MSQQFIAPIVHVAVWKRFSELLRIYWPESDDPRQLSPYGNILQYSRSSDLIVDVQRLSSVHDQYLSSATLLHNVLKVDFSTSYLQKKWSLRISKHYGQI